MSILSRGHPMFLVQQSHYIHAESRMVENQLRFLEQQSIK